MGASLDSVSEAVGDALRALGPEDQRLFLEEKRDRLARRVADSPLLDQACFLRVVTTRLSEGYAAALARFEEGLERKSGMRGGWRKSPTRKEAGEYESPMPWLHPFKLAREDLTLLEEELEAALERGETEARDLGRLRAVLDEHALRLPLPSPHLQPRFRPGAVKVYK